MPEPQKCEKVVTSNTCSTMKIIPRKFRRRISDNISAHQLTWGKLEHKRSARQQIFWNIIVHENLPKLSIPNVNSNEEFHHQTLHTASISENSSEKFCTQQATSKDSNEKFSTQHFFSTNTLTSRDSSVFIKLHSSTICVSYTVSWSCCYHVLTLT